MRSQAFTGRLDEWAYICTAMHGGSAPFAEDYIHFSTQCRVSRALALWPVQVKGIPGSDQAEQRCANDDDDEFLDGEGVAHKEIQGLD